MQKDGSGSENEDLIGYKALSEAAMRGVMREALKVAAKGEALPGAHHFYITFRTAASGVQMADAIRDRFPEEMTIVIQHQYWDLEVHDDRFEVVLKFAGMPQHLNIPYSAVTRFFDPAVNYGLAFETDAGALSDNDETETTASEDNVVDSKDGEKTPEEGTVVSLDAFRRK